MSLHIRIASVEDAQAVNAIYGHYIEHTVATFSEVKKTAEQRAREIEEILKDYPFLIAEDENGSFLGFACAEPFRPQTGYRYTAELTIYLHPDAPKGCGIGSALYEKLLAMLSDQGYYTALGVLYGGNRESLRLHEKFGFEDVLLLPNAAFKHGHWLDMRIMKKTLRPYDEHPSRPIPFGEYRKRL